MTTLDRILAKTFRAARWLNSQGQAMCPDCFEGDALVVDDPPRLAHEGLRSYRCRDCNTRFSDLSGTPLRGSSMPLRDWAIALFTMTGHPMVPSGNGAKMKLRPVDLGPPFKRLARMRLHLADAKLINVQWLAHLRSSGINLRVLFYGRKAGR